MRSHTSPRAKSTGKIQPFAELLQQNLDVKGRTLHCTFIQNYFGERECVSYSSSSSSAVELPPQPTFRPANPQLTERARGVKPLAARQAVLPDGTAFLSLDCPPRPQPSANQGKEGIKFCSVVQRSHNPSSPTGQKTRKTLKTGSLRHDQGHEERLRRKDSK